MKNILLIALCFAYLTSNAQCYSAKELLWNKKGDMPQVYGFPKNGHC